MAPGTFTKLYATFASCKEAFLRARAESMGWPTDEEGREQAMAQARFEAKYKLKQPGAPRRHLSFMDFSVKINHNNKGPFTVNGRELSIPACTLKFEKTKASPLGFPSRFDAPSTTDLYIRSTKGSGVFDRVLAIVRSDGSATFTAPGLAARPFMECWEDDAIETDKILGKACGHCMWCGRGLTVAASQQHGAGDVCYGRYGQAIRLAVNPAGLGAGAVVGSIDAAPREMVVLRPRTGGAALALELPKSVVDNSPLLSGIAEDTDSISLADIVPAGYTAEEVQRLAAVMDTWLRAKNVFMPEDALRVMGLAHFLGIEGLWTWIASEIGTFVSGAVV